MADTTGLILYETARAALAECVRVDEVKQIKSRAEQLRFYGKQIKNRGMIADAQIIVLRAERRIGQLVSEAKAAGLISKGGRPKSNLESERSSRQVSAGGSSQNGSLHATARDSLGPDFTIPPTEDGETDTGSASVSDTTPFTLAEAGIDAKLSAQAQKWAKLGEPEFEAHLAQVRIDIESGGARKTASARAADTASKKAQRAQRAASLAEKHRALPDVAAGIILADPAWRDNGVWSDDTGMDRAPDNHYPTMTLEDIMDLDVGAIAAPDCVLFMWCKASNVDEAFCVAAAWGFAVFGADAKGRLVPVRSGPRYASQIAWDKVSIGNGRWVRDQHEILLMFRRGNPVCPAPGEQLASVLSVRKTEHSAKPEAIADWIDATWPDEVKIELNRRGAPRPGWHAWGNEVESDHDAEQREGEAALTLGFGLTPAEVVGAVTEGLSAGLAGSGVEHQVAATVGQILDQVLAPSQAETDADVEAQDLIEVLAPTPAAAAFEAGMRETLGHDMAEAGNAAINEIIRAGYARNDALSAIAAATGLSENAVQKRAKRMGLSDPVRQREAVAESNRRRVASARSSREEARDSRESRLDQPEVLS